MPVIHGKCSMPLISVRFMTELLQRGCLCIDECRPNKESWEGLKWAHLSQNESWLSEHVQRVVEHGRSEDLVVDRGPNDIGSCMDDNGAKK